MTIRNANVYGFYYGVFLVSASQNTISGNNITTNDIGVVLISSSDYNNVVGNNVKQNNAYGFYVDSSSYNNIYHNNFADNIQQVFTSYSTNIWDHGYPAEETTGMTMEALTQRAVPAKTIWEATA